MESAWLNVLTGISQGSFDTLFVKDANGNWVNILSLGGSGVCSGPPVNLPIGAVVTWYAVPMHVQLYGSSMMQIVMRVWCCESTSCLVLQSSFASSQALALS